MGPKLDPVPLDPTPPAQADVVIIGGGIIGTSAALHLAQRGVSVALCEKGEIAGEQSSRNWGWVRKQGRDPRELPLIIESLRQWQGLNEVVGAETGFRTTGIFYGIETDADMARLIEIIQRSIEPGSWGEGGGSITAFRQQLIVRNTILVHQALGGPVSDGGE